MYLQDIIGAGKLETPNGISIRKLEFGQFFWEVLQITKIFASLTRNLQDNYTCKITKVFASSYWSRETGNAQWYLH